MVRAFSKAEIEEALTTLPRGWSILEEKLHRDFEFKDFKEAFAFMVRVADVAEELNHHPEFCNVFNRVSIDLTTHEVGGVSERDVELARRIG